MSVKRAATGMTNHDGTRYGSIPSCQQRSSDRCCAWHWRGWQQSVFRKPWHNLLQSRSPLGGLTCSRIVIDCRPPPCLFGFSFAPLVLFDDTISSRLSVHNHTIQHLQAETANVHRVCFNLFRGDSQLCQKFFGAIHLTWTA